jgi:uncharacterized protein (DUF433 family)
MLTEMDHRVIACNPKVHDGLPVFAGTSVPIKTLIDYWEGGLPLYEFLIDFPSVKKWQARHVLEWCASIKSAGKDVPAELNAIQNKHTMDAIRPAR